MAVQRLRDSPLDRDSSWAVVLPFSHRSSSPILLRPAAMEVVVPLCRQSAIMVVQIIQQLNNNKYNKQDKG